MLDPERPPTDDPQSQTRANLVGWASGFIIALGAIVVLQQGRDILVPIALAVLIWFLINALADTLRAAPGPIGRLTPLWSKIVAVILFTALLITSGRIIAENLVRIGGDLNPDASPLIAQLLAFGGRFGLPAELTIDTLLKFYPFEELLGAALAITRDLVGDASLVLLYVAFLLLDEPYFDAKLRALTPDDGRREALRAKLGHIAKEARIYLWLMFLLSLGVALMTFAVCAAFGLPGAAFWGFLAFGLNFIPTIGSILAVAIPCFYALLTFSDPVVLAGLIGLLALTQFVAGEIVMPRLMGDHLNLSAVVVLLTLVAWGALWGPVGMFLGIPITVIAILVCVGFPRARWIAVLLSKDGAVREMRDARET
ncbi:MAG: AI-2E family transporter [Pseudomonadota bacterium]